jgi:hypothetical protein
MILAALNEFRYSIKCSLYVTFVPYRDVEANNANQPAASENGCGASRAPENGRKAFDSLMK